MLNWEKNINGYTGHWYGDYDGFDDGALCYSVGKDYEDGGWFFVNYLACEDGECSLVTYLTAEDAMAAADEEYEAHDFNIEWEDLEPLDLEDLEDAYWDEVAHERMEITKGLF